MILYNCSKEVSQEALGEKTLPLLLGRDPSNTEKIFKKTFENLLTNPKEHDIINSQQGKENPKKPERNLL